MKDIGHNDMLPLASLAELAGNAREDYLDAAPFAHGVYDNLFSESLLDQIVDEFTTQKKAWREFDSKYEKKLQMSADSSLPSMTRAFIHNLNSQPFLTFLEELTGIKGLIPDPYLQGAGLHKIERGGKLGIHIDFSGHRKMNLYRRINVLIYLNKEWDSEWGGDFELWSPEPKKRVKKVAPLFNRMVVFSTTDVSFHGHPEPLNCPEDRSRMSLAMYYYTANRSDNAEDFHSTIFLNKEGGTEQISVEPTGLAKLVRALRFW